MFKKSFGKILFFVFNIFLLIGGVLFVKNRESKKAVEITNTPDSESVETSAEIIQNSELVPSSNLPVAEDIVIDDKSTAPSAGSGTTASISASAPTSAPTPVSTPTNSVSNSTSSTTATPTPSKPKTKAS